MQTFSLKVSKHVFKWWVIKEIGGATAGLGLNYDLNNDTAISLDYSWTAYEKNSEFINANLEESAISRPEINSLSLKLKKYF